MNGMVIICFMTCSWKVIMLRSMIGNLQILQLQIWGGKIWLKICKSCKCKFEKEKEDWIFANFTIAYLKKKKMIGNWQILQLQLWERERELEICKFCNCKYEKEKDDWKFANFAIATLMKRKSIAPEATCRRAARSRSGASVAVGGGVGRLCSWSVICNL